MIKDSNNRPKIAVIVGSGGLKSLGGILLFELLERHHIPIDLLIGCSGGSIVVGCKGAGMSVKEMQKFLKLNLKEHLFEKIDYKTIFNILQGYASHGYLSLLDARLIQELYQRLYGELTIEQLDIPTLIQVTDLDTGEGLLLNTGLLREAVYASTSILPFLPPIQVNDRLLTDGGFSNSLPIMEAIKQNTDIIIALNFKDFHNKSNSKNFFSHMFNFFKKVDDYCLPIQNASAISLHLYEIIFIDINFDENIPIWAIDKLPLIFEKTAYELEKQESAILDMIKGFHIYLDNQKKGIL